MKFAHPLFLMLLVPLACFAYLEFSGKRRIKAAVRYSSFDFIRNSRGTVRTRLAHMPRALMYLAAVCGVLALARPRIGQTTEEVVSYGTDIMIVLDTSTSMKALDFKPDNRLDAAKKVVREFIKGRKHDRIGVVVFAAVAFTQCPLTLDYGALLDFLDNVQIGMTQVDGTAIGTAIATAANRLRDSQAKSKIIILLTDGRNNAGEIDPVTAARAAQAVGIRIYTIGAGQEGGALFPVEDPFFGTRYVRVPEEDLDEDTLRRIASVSGGMYYRATSPDKLREIYKEIDRKEKTEIKVEQYTDYEERYQLLLWPGMVFLLAGVALSKTFLKTIP